MDPITHTLTGLALSRAGLNRLAPYATPVALLAANAPDIDVVTSPWGVTSYLHYHRHITHGLIVLPVMAALALLVVRPFARKRFFWGSLFVVACAAVGSHLLLDWLTGYGSRPLLPFSGRWFALDVIPMPDLWIWLVLLLAWIAPALSALVSSEIGARRATGRGWAVFSLVVIAVFVFGRGVLHQRAIEVLNSRMYEGTVPVRVAALPSFANPFAWRGIVETRGFYALYNINLLGEFDPAGGQVLYRNAPDEHEQRAMQAARATETFRVFLDFSRFPLWRFSPDGNGIRVEAFDLRFGSPGRPAFVATALVDSNNRVDRAWFSFHQ